MVRLLPGRGELTVRSCRPSDPGAGVAGLRVARSRDVRPCRAVDSSVGRYVADAEFTGQLPVRQAIRPPRSQLSHVLGCQLGARAPLADGTVVTAVAFAAPRLESAPDVIAGPIGGGPVLGLAAAINAPVVTGRPADFLNTVMPHVIGRCFRPQGGAGQLVAAGTGTAPAVPPDPGTTPADRAPLPFIFRAPARASARPRITRYKGAESGRQLAAAVAPAPDSPVALSAGRNLPHFPDDGELPIFFARIDGVLHNCDVNSRVRHSA